MYSVFRLVWKLHLHSLYQRYLTTHLFHSRKMHAAGEERESQPGLLCSQMVLVDGSGCCLSPGVLPQCWLACGILSLRCTTEVAPPCRPGSFLSASGPPAFTHRSSSCVPQATSPLSHALEAALTRAALTVPPVVPHCVPSRCPHCVPPLCPSRCPHCVLQVPSLSPPGAPHCALPLAPE